ncbi:LysR family transcriptional regulator [Actinobacteria bacterium YIM 96077]|uniref:LysR family transcriptional regulator n=1 Tax=Phytoactinopolyspora halophila TaxID=1981511 RepID=A0A329R0M4_9ACTN|nr:LysR family transcriptional regulator [Phytoactinopolyspora halophila]AYY12738.1 LysR family transcriptional regulator [Actinobacteria bacterium YIM 96077]RAW16468.1 LysR family transcriptional regulator [Phytoactinopolyspora halophila]
MDFSSAYNYRMDWIVSFVAVAREGGFSAAAKAQYRSQPRISSHVSEFERTLGFKLFDRSIHPPALTPEGRALLPHAEEILSRLDILTDVAAEAGGELRGEVHIGMYPSAAAFLYPSVVHRLRRESPGVTTVLRENDTLALERMMIAGDVDLAVRPVLPPVRGDALAHTELWHEPLVAVVPHEHALAGEASLPLERVASYPLVTIGESTDGVRQFETNLAFTEAGLHPTIAFQTNQPQTLAAVVRSGLGVGITNALAMSTANCTGLRLVRVTAGHVARQVAVWWRRDRLASPATTRVRDVIASIPPPQLHQVGVAQR